MKSIVIDFEFNRTQERYVNPVCCTYEVDGVIHERWLHNDPVARRVLAEELRAFRHSHRIVSYQNIAEVRSFLAIGLDPWEFSWVDLYLEFRQVRNGNNARNYGTYFRIGPQGKYACKSVAPHLNPMMNRGKDNTELGYGMGAAVACYFQEDIDQAHKQAMRDLIIEDKSEYTQEERKAIQDYCTSDIKYLRPLWREMTQEIAKLSRKSVQQVLEDQDRRSKVSVSMALCETVGIPLDLPALWNLHENTEKAKNDIIETCVSIYPFWEKNRQGEWVKKQSAFEKFLSERGMLAKWKRTDAGGLAMDDETLSDFDGVPEIKALRQAQKNVNQLKWFRDEAWEEFDRHIGSDGRLRVFLAPFGTQTGRNAPKAKLFVPAMSSWLRCLIRAPEGWAITGIDWASQEFVVAAILARDEQMLQAYQSGDPYQYFAKVGGAIPRDANPLWVKDPGMAPEGEREAYKRHEETRGLFKSTCLAGYVLVITSNGVKPIAKVTTEDYLWDGEEFVRHEGVISNGTKYTRSYYGVQCTPDHRLLCEDGRWREAERCNGEVPGERPVRISRIGFAWSEVRRMVRDFWRNCSSGRVPLC